MEALRTTLEQEGFRTTGFVSANQALGALRSGEFDLLLTDLTMPEMDGVSLLRTATRIDRDLVGVMMTGNGSIATAVEAMRAGALDYILKPFKLSTILPVLSRALEVRRLRIENAELARHVQDRTDELKCLNAELEQRVGQRTLDLQRSLREKTTLLQEVDHRVKNNLQMICSLMTLQIECSSDRSSSGPLTDAYRRVWSMSLIQEQLYIAGTAPGTNFVACIETLAGHLFDAYCTEPARIRLELSLEPVALPVDHAIPCGLIVHELLANSLQHAFAGGRAGTVRIGLSRIGLKESGPARVELCVADDGIGLPADFDYEHAQTMGLQVVRALIAQLRGNFRLSSERGTEFTIDWDA
jgi:two-component sensor histidine kinase/CheY-like chemotaxis protein